MKQEKDNSGVDLTRGKARRTKRRRKALDRNVKLLNVYQKNKSKDKDVKRLEKEIEILKTRI